MTLHSFDFSAYLEQITGVKGWDIKELIGGAANFTVRVRRGDLWSSADDEKSPTFGIFNTEPVIIKQAPNYLAKFPEIPFSPYRQTIEAEALRIFHSCLLRNVLLRNPSIRIPKLLLHDKSSNVLVQTDLGTHPSLYEVLTSPDTSISTASQLGRVIGHFLADMHNSSAMSPSLINKFYNEDAERVMEDIITQATSFLQDARVADYQVLGKAALNHWRTRKKAVFGQGDLWFGTLLVDIKHPPRSGVDQSSTMTVGICDWEFAGPNDPAADIAQLGSYLHLLSICPLTTTQVIEVIVTFAEDLYSGYFTSLKIPLDSEFLKSLLIMHGWEMVNAAGWSSRQDRWCSCKGQGVRCAHIKALVEEGAKLLRAAADGFKLHILEGIPWSQFLPLSACRLP